MRGIILALGTLAAALVVGIFTVIIFAGGASETTYRVDASPLLEQWQRSIGLDTLICGTQDAGPIPEQGADILAGDVTQLPEIYNDIESLNTPKRYQPGVEAMAAIAIEIEMIDLNRNKLALALQDIALFDPQEALADLPPTNENQSWFIRVGGAFETWGNDFQAWSDFVDCALAGEPDRVGEMTEHMRQMQIGADQLKRLQTDGPQEMTQAFAPLLSGIEVATQAFAGLSRALESQVEVERIFADVIAAE